MRDASTSSLPPAVVTTTRVGSPGGAGIAAWVVLLVGELVELDEVVLERVVAEGFLVGDVLLEARDVLDELLPVILLGAT